jgi:hypothetical protein
MRPSPPIFRAAADGSRESQRTADHEGFFNKIGANWHSPRFLLARHDEFHRIPDRLKI